MPVPDEELVSQAQAGRTAAFDELVARHQERVFALAYRILGNADEAEDVQQETFVRAWTSLRAFRGQAAFTTWLHRIAVNASLSLKRRGKRVSCLEELDEGFDYAQTSNPMSSQDRIVNSMLVRQLLNTIPAEQRALLVLREVEGRSVAEIAQLIGSSVEGTRKQLWRVRKLFRERLRCHLAENER